MAHYKFNGRLYSISTNPSIFTSRNNAEQKLRDCYIKELSDCGHGSRVHMGQETRPGHMNIKWANTVCILAYESGNILRDPLPKGITLEFLRLNAFICTD